MASYTNLRRRCQEIFSDSSQPRTVSDILVRSDLMDVMRLVLKLFALLVVAERCLAPTTFQLTRSLKEKDQRVFDEVAVRVGFDVQAL